MHRRRLLLAVLLILPLLGAAPGLRADEPGSGRVSSACLRASSDALCARTIELPRWRLASLTSAASAAELQPLEIASKSGVHVFAVEMATTPEEQAKGLMFRRSLPEGQGMLFDFHQEQPTSFWMKNTYVSLDMIFIRGDGRILRIAENTVPLSEALVPSGGPVRAVLEVVAGTAKKLGIAPGDRVAHPIFGGR
jgi:uncharacterized membrane protein (UPF0127 family)